MRPFRRSAFLLVCLGGLVTSCDDDVVNPVDGPSPYASPTEPESLITNLQVSYRRREIEEYAKLLAPEFIFKFQPIDANDIGTPFWTRDQDSTGTRALLTTPEVSDIRLSLIYGARDLTVDTTPPVDSLRIRIITTDLQVDQTDGTTWLVSDQQDFFFRQGKATNGEDPTHWFIYEWDDLPSLGSPNLLEVNSVTWGRVKSIYSGPLQSPGLLGEPVTWGKIKSLYGPTLKSAELQTKSVTWGKSRVLLLVEKCLTYSPELVHPTAVLGFPSS